MQRNGTSLSDRVAYWIAAVTQDLRCAVRSLSRSAGFTTVAVLTLALGIGATTAMFTVVNSVLLRPLPYPEADRLVSLWTRYLPESGYDFPQFQLSGPEFVDYRAQTRALTDVAAYVRAGALIVPSGAGREPIRVEQVIGSANLFTTLGVQAALGRTFVPEDEQPGAACIAVLSHGLWLDAFGGDSSVVGGSASIGGMPCTIAGVMPAGFAFPDAQPRVWRNLVLDPAAPGWGRLNHNFSAVARLAPGVTFEQAEAETVTLMRGWVDTYADHYKGHSVFLRHFLDDVVASVRGELTMLLAAVGLVLVIVCANLASLLLARGEGRRREVGVRVALGGGRGRLIVHLLGESVVLAAVGGALGIGCAVLFLDALLALYPGTLPRSETIAIDWSAFAFAALATGVSAASVGLIPALRSAATSPSTVLRTQGRGAGGLARRSRLMRGLVVAEVALSVMLVAGAALLLRSYENVRGVDLGFDADGVYTVSQALPPTAYPTDDSVRAFYALLLDRIGALPGVRSAGAVTSLPLVGGAGAMDDFNIEGRRPATGEPQFNAGFVMATPGYFATLRIPLIAGRDITSADQHGTPLVAVINEEAARRYWPNDDPIGRRLRYNPLANPQTEPEWITIVGVVKNTRVNGAQAEPRPQIFVPHAQTPRAGLPGRLMAIVVRAASGDAAALAPSVRAVMRDADRALPPIGGRPMADIVSDSVGQPRFTSTLVTFFAAVALALGALGIHGVLSYVVSQRFGELGVRLALGAQPSSVVRLVVGQGMWLTVLGAGLGVGGALAAARVFRGLLFGVQPVDFLSLAAAVAILCVAGFLSCYGPARRAARIDPAVALRAE